eukprot:SAG31_NODE_2327_length_5934_cov_7.878835_1_plen_300_part_00
MLLVRTCIASAVRCTRTMAAAGACMELNAWIQHRRRASLSVLSCCRRLAAALCCCCSPPLGPMKYRKGRKRPMKYRKETMTMDGSRVTWQQAANRVAELQKESADPEQVQFVYPSMPGFIVILHSTEAVSTAKWYVLKVHNQHVKAGDEAAYCGVAAVDSQVPSVKLCLPASQGSKSDESGVHNYNRAVQHLVANPIFRVAMKSVSQGRIQIRCIRSAGAAGSACAMSLLMLIRCINVSLMYSNLTLHVFWFLFLFRCDRSNRTGHYGRDQTDPTTRAGWVCTNGGLAWLQWMDVRHLR